MDSEVILHHDLHILHILYTLHFITHAMQHTYSHCQICILFLKDHQSSAVCRQLLCGRGSCRAGTRHPSVLTCAEHRDYISPPGASQHTGYNFIAKCSQAFQNIYLKTSLEKCLKFWGGFFEQNLTLLEVNAEADFILENPISP